MTYVQMQAKQLQLSIVLAVIFLASIFSIPFLNQAMPETMLQPVAGLPLVWLLVGFALHLELWAIALVYTLYSNRWEREMIHG